MIRPHRLTAAVVVVAGLVAPTAPAHAQASEAERKRRAFALIEEGQARFDLGKFDEAITLFANAYEIWPYAEALYNLAQAHRMKKDYEKAIFFYKSYLRNRPEAANREQVEARIVELEELRAQQEREARQPPTGTTGPAAPPGAGAGAGGAGDAAAATRPLPPRLPEVWWRDDWGWVLAAGGLVSIAGGLWLVDEAGRLDDEADGSMDQIRVDELRDGALYRRIGGWGAVGLGAAGVVTGVWRLAVTDPGDPLRPGPLGARAGRGTRLVVAPAWLGVAGTF